MKIKDKYSAKIIWSLITLVVILTSCKNEYITGGQTVSLDKYKDITTFDYLKSVQQFDTLVQVLEAGNLQAKVNEPGTLFAVSNRMIYFYLLAKTINLQNNVNQNAKFPLDSLKYYVKNNINGTRDSLLMYFVPGVNLTADLLTNEGKVYQSGLANNKVAVSYEFTKEGALGYTNLVSGVPQVVYFTQLWKPYTIDKNNPISDIPDDTGVRTLVGSAFIKTKTGVVNILRPYNTLFYYGER